MSNETCPHCGAERERYDSGFVRYKCGSSMSRHIADNWASSLSSNCYLNQLAQRNAEIARLRNALNMFMEAVPEPPDSNCSCHLHGPCDDCMDFAFLREAFSAAKLILKVK